jgi:hypothetical protein
LRTAPCGTPETGQVLKNVGRTVVLTIRINQILLIYVA